MSRKQRTPEEIEAEMQDQEVDQEEDQDEDADEEESDEEEQEEESEEDEDDEPGDDPDKYAILLEDEADLLCLGYSPEQLEKLMPPLLEQVLLSRKSQIKASISEIGAEPTALLEEAWDEHMVPAIKAVIRDLRASYGADNGKLKTFMDKFAERFLYHGTKSHFDGIYNLRWPKPENG